MNCFEWLLIERYYCISNESSLEEENVTPMRLR